MGPPVHPVRNPLGSPSPIQRLASGRVATRRVVVSEVDAARGANLIRTRMAAPRPIFEVWVAAHEADVTIGHPRIFPAVEQRADDPGSKPLCVKGLVSGGGGARRSRPRVGGVAFLLGPGVASPKCRCQGSGRPRWIEESPLSALPGPLRKRRRPVGGRRRRRRVASTRGALPSWSCPRRSCGRSRRGPGCRGGSGRPRSCASHGSVAGSRAG